MKRRECMRYAQAAMVSLPILFPVAAAANDFTAEKVMKEMDEKQRVSYLAGVVEGLEQV